MPPRGWPSLEWPEKRKILFETYSPSEGEIEMIRAALPDRSPPARPRRLLVFYRCQYPHVSIATGVTAFELMAEATGAFEVTASDDPLLFRPQTLARYDAVLLNNTTSFDDTIGPTGRDALVDYVRTGGGLIGIHAAADSCKRWPTGAEMIGGVFAGHPWTSRGTWAFKTELPPSPLNAAFEGDGFRLNDEVYWYRGFSGQRSRVLLSLDMSGGKNRGGPGFQDRFRERVDPNKQYPVAWVHEYDKGRVFYSNLGHNPSTYWNPAVLRHYLDGIRFALGDQPADALPAEG